MGTTICLSLGGGQLQSVFDSVTGTTICLSLGGSELQSVFDSVTGTTICLSHSVAVNYNLFLTQ